MVRCLLVVVALSATACANAAEPTESAAAAARARTVVHLAPPTTVGVPTTAGAPSWQADECYQTKRTLETAVEAYYMTNGRDIAVAQDLVVGGFVDEIDPAFTLEWGGEIPLPIPVPDGSCDFDFEAEVAAADTATGTDQLLADWYCWMDQIAVEVAASGFAAEIGRRPSSLDEIAVEFPDFSPDSWPTAAIGPDGAVVDLVEGGCRLGGNVATLGLEWVDADPQCAVDVWTLSYAMVFTDSFGHPGTSIATLVQAGLIEERSYSYDLVDGGVIDIDGSGCPIMNAEDAPDAEDASDSENGPEHACEVQKRTIDTATEAFFAQEGRAPTSISELADDGRYLRDDVDGWTLVHDPQLDTLTARPVPGASCDGVVAD